MVGGLYSWTVGHNSSSLWEKVPILIADIKDWILFPSSCKNQQWTIKLQFLWKLLLEVSQSFYWSKFCMKLRLFHCLMLKIVLNSVTVGHYYWMPSRVTLCHTVCFWSCNKICLVENENWTWNTHPNSQNLDQCVLMGWLWMGYWSMLDSFHNSHRLQ